MGVERCPHLLTEGPREWAVVSVAPIPWSDRPPEATPHTVYACFDCAMGALAVVRGLLCRDTARKLQEAERRFEALAEKEAR